MRWMVGPGSALELAPPGNLQAGELTRYLTPMMRYTVGIHPRKVMDGTATGVLAVSQRSSGGSCPALICCGAPSSGPRSAELLWKLVGGNSSGLRDTLKHLYRCGEVTRKHLETYSRMDTSFKGPLASCRLFVFDLALPT